MEAISKEGSLKLKEITYMHAEGYSGSSLKHGPFALIEDKTPVFLISPDDEHFSKMNNAAQEVKARKATTILITNKEYIDESIYDFIIKIPKNGILDCILSIIPIQLIAYKLSILKNINPDFPRNLAKVVTVE